MSQKKLFLIKSIKKLGSSLCRNFIWNSQGERSDVAPLENDTVIQKAYGKNRSTFLLSVFPSLHNLSVSHTHAFIDKSKKKKIYCLRRLWISCSGSGDADLFFIRTDLSSSSGISGIKREPSQGYLYTEGPEDNCWSVSFSVLSMVCSN